MLFRRISNAKDKLVSSTRGASSTTDSASAGPVVQITAMALRQLNRLQLNASRFLPGHAVGLRPSLRRKPAVDFREHRKYVPGDDVRFVDWKASARQEHIFVKQGEHPKEATVYVLLDCSASMAWGDPPKSFTALSLAAAVGYLALAHGDHLMVVPMAMVGKNHQSSDAASPITSPTTIQPLGPISGKGQFPGLLNYLRALPFKGQVDFTLAARNFSHRVALGGGLTLIISDLFDVQDPGTALEFLPVPTWDVVVFHLLHSEELNPTARGEFEMQDIETGRAINYDITAKALETYRQRIQDWRSNLELACVQSNAFYTLIPSDWALDSEIIPHLRDINVVKPL